MRVTVTKGPRPVGKLGDHYSAAWAEWAASTDHPDWEQTSCDGLLDPTDSSPKPPVGTSADRTTASKQISKWRKS